MAYTISFVHTSTSSANSNNVSKISFAASTCLTLIYRMGHASLLSNSPFSEKTLYPLYEFFAQWRLAQCHSQHFRVLEHIILFLTQNLLVSFNKIRLTFIDILLKTNQKIDNNVGYMCNNTTKQKIKNWMYVDRKIWKHPFLLCRLRLSRINSIWKKVWLYLTDRRNWFSNGFSLLCLISNRNIHRPPKIQTIKTNIEYRSLVFLNMSPFLILFWWLCIIYFVASSISFVPNYLKSTELEPQRKTTQLNISFELVDIFVVWYIFQKMES